ncbi:response regulator transcription factor [Actinoplanes nipponensis]|uniref:response regulator transcription factor n=1 Tax=Actinoplanes nipponensis TaxID=135950 RepID=UPI003F68E7E9
MAPLTPRETEILRLVGTGRSNTAIARTLVVSEATVKTHLARLMAKLGPLQPGAGGGGPRTRPG